MVQVGVGDYQMGDVLSGLKRGQHGLDVGGVVRAGIENRYLTPADEIGAGPIVRKGTRILGDHPPDERRERHGLTVRRLRLGDEWDRCCHLPLLSQDIVGTVRQRKVGHTPAVGLSSGS